MYVPNRVIGMMVLGLSSSNWVRLRIMGVDKGGVGDGVGGSRE